MADMLTPPPPTRLMNANGLLGITIAGLGLVSLVEDVTVLRDLVSSSRSAA